MMYRFVIVALTLLISTAAQARPVSYPGGWTVMQKNDKDLNSLHIHKTINPKNSIGWKHEYSREDSINADFIQHNVLLKRWNAKGSQANLYLKSGLGVAYTDDETRAAAFTGLAADWENRRYFTSYENRFYTAGNLNKFVKHKARVGIAPYIGDFGDVHTWLMLQADYDAGDDDNFSMTPLVRLFQGTHMLEAGYNLDDGALLNYVKRF